MKVQLQHGVSKIQYLAKVTAANIPLNLESKRLAAKDGQVDLTYPAILL